MEQQESDRQTFAYTLPFGVFMAFLAVPEFLSMLGLAGDSGGDTQLKLWLFPIQTLATAIALALVWKRLMFGPHKGFLLATGCGLLGIVVWLLPGHLFNSVNMSEGWWKYLGFGSRLDGFNPSATGEAGSAGYLFTIAVRFLRLVVIVPLVEELFWRGFLMRYTTDLEGDYWKVPFGTYNLRSMLMVTGGFVLVHSSVDYAAAIVFGLLMYAVAVRTKSLSACVLMHAVANLVLGCYVMSTESWGYW